MWDQRSEDDVQRTGHVHSGSGAVLRMTRGLAAIALTA